MPAPTVKKPTAAVAAAAAAEPTVSGPVDPSRCTAGGAGIGGGTAGTVATFVVTSADAEGNRLRVGGASVGVTVIPSGLGGRGLHSSNLPAQPEPFLTQNIP